MSIPIGQTWTQRLQLTQLPRLAAPPSSAEALYESFAERLRAGGLTVGTGYFGAMMDVELVNDGPVTVIVELAPKGADR